MAQEKEIIVGIDPGVGGGLAWSICGGSLAVANMPDTPHELTALLEELQREGPVRIYLEKVGGYIGGDGNTGSSMFTFGTNFGRIEGVSAALKIPLEPVTPQKWQSALSLGTSAGLTKSQWKKKLKLRALQLYPSTAVSLKVADAILIYHAASKGLV